MWDEGCRMKDEVSLAASKYRTQHSRRTWLCLVPTLRHEDEVMYSVYHFVTFFILHPSSFILSPSPCDLRGDGL